MDGFDQRTPWHCYDIWEHTCAAVEAVPPVPQLRWAALLHDSGKPACFSYENGAGHFHGHPAVSERIATEILSCLKCSKKRTTAVRTLVRNHELRLLEGAGAEEMRVRLRKLLGKFGKETLLDLLELARADVLAQAPEKRFRLQGYAPLREEICSLANTCVTRKQLEINGNDLLPFGLQGQQLGQTLNRLLEEVVAGRLENTKEALLDNVQFTMNREQ
jgi:tRNA nucleotidyltransferase (CCA-adding enzyme)